MIPKDSIKKNAQDYTAIGIFQGDHDWDISVRVPGFKTRKSAERYANRFHIRLTDGHLYREKIGFQKDSWDEIRDSEVSLSRLKPESRTRVAQAHIKYREQGLNQVEMALQSIKDFESAGYNDLVMTEDDYEPIDIPISRWHEEPGLSCGFESLAYAVQDSNQRQEIKESSDFNKQGNTPEGTDPTTPDVCPKCSKPWEDHEFGVPAPYCP